MPESEVELLRERMRALASKDLLCLLAGAMWAHLKIAGEPRRSEALAEIEEALSFGRRAAQEVLSFPTLSASESDMCASEYEEAYTRIATEVLEKIRGT